MAVGAGVVVVGGVASIALLAGLNSSLRSFSCSHYKDSQRQRVGEPVKRGGKEGRKERREKSSNSWFVSDQVRSGTSVLFVGSTIVSQTF